MGAENKNNTGFGHLAIHQHITLAVVDDHDLLREKTCEILTGFGFDVIMKAGNGQEFLDILGNSPILPNICILDISIPVVNGYETAKKIKALYPEIKILAFSLSMDTSTIAKIMENGANGFMPKTTGLTALRDALTEMHNNYYNP